jgi:predicted XRE-type DNA-binding protein
MLKQAKAKVAKTKAVALDDIEVEASSGNVFADLGFPNPEKHKVKSGLAFEIQRGMKRLKLNQAQAAERMGISQPKVSGLLRGDFSGLSENKLMECLTRLGYDVEIKVRRAPAAQKVGHLMFAAA